MHESEITLRVMGSELRFFLPDAATDHVQSQIKRDGVIYESDLLRFASTFLSPGDHVLDVGAYIGTHTVFFGAICHASVTAFEPNPASRAVLRRNVELNDLLGRVRIVEAAAGEAKGVGRVETPRPENRGDTRVVADESGSIPIVALDDLELPTTRLIKIDVQGGELAVLRGARRLIDRDRPVLFVEAASPTESLILGKLLAEHDYVVVAQLAATPTFFCAHVSQALPIQTQTAVAAHATRGEVVRYSARLQEALRGAQRIAQQERQDLAVALQRLGILEQQLRSLRSQLETDRADELEARNDLSRALHRIESRLVSLRSSRPTTQPKSTTQTMPTPGPKKNAKRTRKPRVLRKLQKLVRDPDAFIRDSRLPWLRRLSSKPSK